MEQIDVVRKAGVLLQVITERKDAMSALFLGEKRSVVEADRFTAGQSSILGQNVVKPVACRRVPLK